MDYRIEAFLNSINSCIDVVSTKVKESKQLDFSILAQIYVRNMCYNIWFYISVHILINATLKNVN